MVGSQTVAPLSMDQPHQTIARNQGRYGWASFTPNCIQRLHNPKFLLFCMCFALFAQRAGFALFPSIVTTISQRFQLNTTQIGFISSFNDVVGVVIAMFVAHYGEKGHKGRWMGWSFVLALIGLVAFTIPQWISEPYGYEAKVAGNASGSNAQLCLLNGAPSQCSEEAKRSSWTSAPLWLFTFAATLQAVAATPFSILGTPYIDENVLQSSSPVYLAVTFGTGLFASALGFSISAVFLKIYGDFYRLPSDQLPQAKGSDSFYGAWWLGYIAMTPLLAIAILPMFGFARELPNKARYRARDVEQTHGGETKVFGGNWSDYPKALKILIANPVFILNLVRAAVQLFFISGVITFLPLYFEQILQFPRSVSGMLTGVMLLVPVLIGTLIVSVIMKKLKLTSKALLILSVVFSSLSVFPGIGFLLGCPTPKMAGVTTDYSGQVIEGAEYSLNDTCNKGCRCTLAEYRPACFRKESILFYNPCFAGCQSRSDSSQSPVFSQCSCLRDHFGDEAELDNGQCPLSKRCRNMKYVICFLIIIGFFIGGMEVQPLIQLGLRTIPFSQRTMATGIKSVVVKLFGFAPGPVIFGHFLDKACLQRIVTCGQPGACAKYDHAAVTQGLVIVSTATHVIAVACSVLSLLLYKPPKETSMANKLVKRMSKPVLAPSLDS